MRKQSWIWKGALLMLMAGNVGWYVSAAREAHDLSDDVRDNFCPTTTKLTNGITCYDLVGPKNGKALVLIHGATIPSWVFDPQMEDFANAGFRVLRYDMFGRGYSDRPAEKYDRVLYVRQLRELLETVGMSRNAALVGISFGAAIATTYASLYPNRVDALVLGSPIINSVQNSLPFVVVRLPVLDRLLVRTVMLPVFRKRARIQYERSRLNVSHYDNLFVKQTTFKGFENAFRSMFETDALGDYRNAYKKVGTKNIRTMLFWGDQDQTIPPQDVDLAKELLQGVRFEKFPGRGHTLNIEEPERFNRLVIDFLTTK